LKKLAFLCPTSNKVQAKNSSIMVTETFKVNNKQRFGELQNFLETNMPTAQLKGTPVKNSETYDIAISYEMCDIEKLEELHNKWYQLDHTAPKKASVWQRFLPLF